MAYSTILEVKLIIFPSKTRQNVGFAHVADMFSVKKMYELLNFVQAQLKYFLVYCMYYIIRPKLVSSPYTEKKQRQSSRYADTVKINCTKEVKYTLNGFH